MKNAKNIQVAVLVGTRPELIKIAPALCALEKRSIRYLFIHSNQHYSEELDKKIISDLQIRKPDVNLGVGSSSQGEQTANILTGMDKILQRYTPKILLVHGDTNTTLGGALSAKKMHVPVAHIEAGLRSFDLEMPEEVNRTLTDHISTVLFAPTRQAKINLLKEGISKNVFVTGNTIADAVRIYAPLIAKSGVLEKQKIVRDQYILATAHRPENVDSESRLEKLMRVFSHAGTYRSQEILWPIHPRTQKNIQRYHIAIPRNIHVIRAVGYIDMLALLSNASLVITDSGGIQEEAYILHRPLITVRSSTERPETMSANFLVDLSREKMTKALRAYKSRTIRWHPAFGDGKASERIVDIIINKFLRT